MMNSSQNVEKNKIVRSDRTIKELFVTLPLIKQFWKYVRERKILRAHQEVVQFWKPIIDAYDKGNVERLVLRPKKELPENKIIWQYWGQGGHTHELPEIVQICFDSVDKYKGDYQVIRLDDHSIQEYLDFPEFIWEKRDNPAFNRTFFSDLLRLALLQVYGGVWLDATILMTGPLPQKFAALPYFMFQRSAEVKNKSYWESTYAYYWGWKPQFKVKVLNSIVFAKKENPVITKLLDLLLHYWKYQDQIVDYFFFQILYNELISDKLRDEQCEIVSDTIPHLIQTKVNGQLEDISYEQVFAQTTLHKMAYYDEKALHNLKHVLTTY